MAVTTTTLLNLVRQIARELGYASGRASAGSTTRITDTSADSPFMSSDDALLYQNAWALIEAANGVDATGAKTFSRARTTNVATIVTQTAHGLTTSDKVTISGVGASAYNVANVAVTVTTTTAFTYSNTGSDEATASDTDGVVTPTLPLGEVRRIASYTPASQLVDTDSSNPFSVTVATSHDYGLYQQVPPIRTGARKGLQEYINEVLRETYYRTQDLLTEAQDRGMETGGTATSNGWTASNATLAYATTAATGVLLGSRALSVTASSDGGYAQQSFSVRGSEQWDIAVDLVGKSGDQAQLVITSDGTGPSTTTISAASGEAKPVRLYASHSVPSDATLLYVRLTSVTNADVTYWDNLSVRRSLQTDIALPSWVLDPSWVEKVEMWVPYATGTTGVGTIDNVQRVPMTWFRVSEDYTGLTPFRLSYHPIPRQDAHIVIQGVRPYAELATLGATTACNKDMLRATVLTRAYTDLGQKEKAARWAAESEMLQRAYNAMARKQQSLQMAEKF